MLKAIFISSFVFIACLGCQEGKISCPFIYGSETPSWLLNKIGNMTGNIDYFGTKVYRYQWNGRYVYHIMIPISSCAYCELYEYNGVKVNFDNDASFDDFLRNKKNQMIIWEYGKG